MLLAVHNRIPKKARNKRHHDNDLDLHRLLVRASSGFGNRAQTA